MGTLKFVYVIITIFTREKKAKALRDYIKNCIDIGSVANLFKDPNILTAFYDEGTTAYEELRDAIIAYDKNKSDDNTNIVKDKMALAVLWLREYAKKVQTISNLPANCTTREEAATNIGLSYLTAEKLIQSKQGKPETAVITAKYIGDGIIEVTITNGKTFKATSVSLVAVGMPPVTNPATPNPVMKLKDGQIEVSSKVAIKMTFKTMNGKGKTKTLSGMNTCPRFLVALFSQNGEKQTSLLSNIVLVEIISPEE